MKKMIALLLAAAMLLVMLTACANEKEAAGQPQDFTQGTQEEPAPEQATTPEEPEEDEPEEIAELNVYLMGGTNQDDAETVEDAINAILEPEIGVRVHFTFLTGMEYPTGLSMAIAGGETVDVCTICPLATGAYNILQSSGQLMDIAPYLETEGQELVELLGDYLGAFSVGDAVYGIPTLRNMNSSMYFNVRRDVMEELGTVEAVENATSFTDLEEVFAQVKANTDFYIAGYQNNVMTCAGYQIGADRFADCYAYDFIDSLYAVVTDDAGNVSNLYTTEEYVQTVERVARWNELGYIYPDSLMTQETSQTLIKNGMEIANFVSGELGIADQQTARIGFPMMSVKITDAVLGAGAIVKWGAGVPITAEEPEVAVRFLNYIYQSPEIMNLIAFGVEGEHYVDDGGVARYPEGISSDNTSYHFGEIFGNSFLILPWDTDPDYRKQMQEDNDKAKLSYYVNMAFSGSELTEEIAAISALQSEYCNPFNVGLYTEESYQEFLEKLETAGIDRYIANYQAQVDAQK